jgi:hypothetical protein
MSQYVTKIRTDEGDKQIDYNALANLPTISNPNLLINGDFRNPVNQRGITKYEGQTSKGYSIDRWCIGEQDYQRTVEVVNGGITITNPNTTYIGTLQQIFEHTLPQGDYTLSVKVKSVARGRATMSCGGSHYETKKDLLLGVNTLTLTDATVDSFKIYLEPDSQITLEWAKLEVGTTPTPFSPRPYAEEIALCQRYVYVWKPVDHYTLAYHIFKSNSNSINFSVQLPFVMRASPSLSVLGGSVSCVYNDNFNETYGSTSIEIDIANNYTAKVKANFGITFRTDDPVEFFAYSSLGLLFDAEIY